MTSLTWIKRIMGIGLGFMTPDTQMERMDRVFKDGRIKGAELAQLIDECKNAAGIFLKDHSGFLGADEENLFADILKQTDGKQIVANMADEADAAWLRSFLFSPPESALCSSDTALSFPGSIPEL